MLSMQNDKPYVVYLPKEDVPQKLNRDLLDSRNESIRNKVEQLYEAGSKPFIVQDGPAYLNGDLHAGHHLNKTLKDILCKQLLLDGYKVDMRLGGDCHGLPIENRVKKEGGYSNDEEFLRRCKEVAERFMKQHREMLYKFGIHFTTKEYLTMDDAFIKREQDIFQKLVKDGVVLKKEKPTWYSPTLKTTLANSEVVYGDVTDESVYFFFHLKEGLRLLVWTTTEWTIAGNQAVCMNPNVEYCKANGDIVCSKRYADEQRWMHEPFDVSTLTVYTDHYGNERPVLMDDFVQDDHTGIVHLCGGHGDEDFEVLIKHGIEPKNAASVDDMLYHMENYRMKEEFLHRKEDVTHSVTLDWRNGDRVIKVLTEQTYLDFDLNKIKQVLKQIKMTGRDRKRLEGMVFSRKDWCLSRQRKWGVPIDENNILDVWFDSGTVFAMNDGPADIYIEGHDQHRGWFQSSTIIAAMMGRVPTKRIVSHGFVIDEYSRKLAKSLGNARSLEELYQEFGPDVLRLWVVLSDYTDNVTFSEDSMKSAAKQYFKARNRVRYFVNNLYRSKHSHDDVDPELKRKIQELKDTISHEVVINMSPSKAFRAIDKFLGDYSSGLTEPRKDDFYESELDVPERIALENEFHFLAQEVGKMLFPFTPFLSVEITDGLKEPS